MQTLDGDTIITDVTAWGNAHIILKEKGIDVDKVYYHPIHGRAYYSTETTYLHVYFSKNGKEVAYFTPCLHNLFIFNEPRDVDEIMMDNVKYLHKVK